MTQNELITFDDLEDVETIDLVVDDLVEGLVAANKSFVLTGRPPHVFADLRENPQRDITHNDVLLAPEKFAGADGVVDELELGDVTIVVNPA